jgi:hypothetical protein
MLKIGGPNLCQIDINCELIVILHLLSICAVRQIACQALTASKSSHEQGQIPSMALE